ncbi:MAG: hypothetical protein AAFQ43_01680 [Bacteroidota bacterium]
MRIALVLLLLALGSDAVAQHNASYRPTGSVTTTAVSGTASTYEIGTLRNFGADVIYSLSLYEGASGGMCAAEATGWTAQRGFFPTQRWQHSDRFDHLTERLGSATRTVVDCRGGRRSAHTVEADFPRPPQSTTPGPQPIRIRGHYGTPALTGVRVCTDGSTEGTVFGIRAEFSTLNEGGNGRIQRSGEETVEIRGCRQWQRAQRCPKGQVASGVDLHYTSGGQLKGSRMTGVALRCQAIEISALD